MEKLNLLVATRCKRRAFALASDRDMSVGRLFEKLLDQEGRRAGVTA